MKMVSGFILAMLVSASSHAFAFITVIDVTEVAGKVTTIQSPSEYPYENLLNKEIVYRGKAEEAISLFEGVVKLGTPQGLTEIDSEFNASTGTVSVTVRVQGVAGWIYNYWIMKKSGG